MTITAFVLRASNGAESTILLDETTARRVRGALLESSRSQVRTFAHRALVEGAR